MTLSWKDRNDLEIMLAVLEVKLDAIIKHLEIVPPTDSEGKALTVRPRDSSRGESSDERGQATGYQGGESAGL